MDEKSIIINLVEKVISDTDHLLTNAEIVDMLQKCGLSKNMLNDYGFANLLDGHYLTRENARNLLAAGDGKNIVIPEDYTTIGEGAFRFCGSLESVSVPASVTTIEESAFHGCIALKKVEFPKDSHLVDIGESTFAYCKNLSTIEIPASVIRIGSSAFYNCHAEINYASEKKPGLDGIISNARARSEAKGTGPKSPIKDIILKR